MLDPLIDVAVLAPGDLDEVLLLVLVPPLLETGGDRRGGLNLLEGGGDCFRGGVLLLEPVDLVGLTCPLGDGDLNSNFLPLVKVCLNLSIDSLMAQSRRRFFSSSTLFATSCSLISSERQNMSELSFVSICISAFSMSFVRISTSAASTSSAVMSPAPRISSR